MLTTVLFFAIGGALLLLTGLLGLRGGAARASAVDGWDEEAQEQRHTVLRRGSITCTALGGIFLAMAAATPWLYPHN